MHDPSRICDFLVLLCKLPLTGREIKYFVWRFYFNYSADKIIQEDGRKISRQAVTFIIREAIKKIKRKYITMNHLWERFNNVEKIIK